MRIKDIELSNISRYRGELMGVAIIFIILFHVELPRNDLFFGLRRMGNIGVDLFLFLSGIGLWFSWTKNHAQKTEQEDPQLSFSHKYRDFLKRRFLRIYPAWLIIASLYYIPRFHPTTPMSWIDLIGDISINWDFWLHDELTFWYIPAIMMLYLWAPPYMELIRRHPIYRWLPVAMVMWCVIVQWVTPIHNLVAHIEIFWSRVPIFFIGINMGEMVRRKKTIDGTGIWMILLMFTMALAACVFLEQKKHGHFPLFVERMLYIPLTITAILLLNSLFQRTPNWLKATLRLFGTLSLEIYLIHSHFILDYLPSPWNYWLTFFICVACTMPLAWLLHRISDLIAKYTSPHI